jgi:cellulose synthase operon protein C
LAAGKQKDAERLFEATADEFERRKAAPASPAGYHAARAKFLLAEFALKKYESMKIEGKSTEQVKALQKKSEELKKMEKLYQDVLPYKQLDWALATAYRLGYLYENLAESVLASPCPKDVQRVGEEACDEYRILLEDRFAAPLEAKASAAYQAAVDRAKEAKVQNEWTRRALEGLKKYQKDLQVDKEPKRRMVGVQYPGIDVALPADEAGEQKSLKGK